MATKREEAQSHIDGEEVARIIMDFWREFETTYPLDVQKSSLCAVGPLQSMIGLAIKNGRLSLPPHRIVGVPPGE